MCLDYLNFAVGPVFLVFVFFVSNNVEQQHVSQEQRDSTYPLMVRASGALFWAENWQVDGEWSW